jgi:hypothetical protein
LIRMGLLDNRNVTPATRHAPRSLKGVKRHGNLDCFPKRYPATNPL